MSIFWLMKIYVGTSGYSYKEWKGSFYPAELPDGDMLSYYGGRFNTVEINNTFYRLPTAKLLASWAAQVPEGFRFTLKASRKITHEKRLKEAQEETDYLVRTALGLDGRLGTILFQLPPNLKKDAPRLENFLKLLPRDLRASFEFRHPTWMDDEVFALLRGANAALCLSDTDESPAAELPSTADWGYLRLRRSGYETADLAAWAQKLRERKWKEAYLYFKHEEAGIGAQLAERFRELWEQSQ
jgi:uncharacterized protein YecE (DUF72 family)